MAPIALALRVTTLLCALAIFSCSIVIFYKSGDAFFRLATNFPPDRYIWYGNKPADEGSEYGMVRLAYDWSTENFIWVAAGTSVVTGIFSVIAEAVRGTREWRQRRDGTKRLSRYMLIVLTVVSLFVAAGYWTQIRLARRGAKGGVDAEERVRRLQEEE
ncbi:hypothetical protein N0V90_008552 [Kalmusia sp. IMI 367209]|nr:hypothetical protein N0V90_008552 [Kalmusia sp. IMI 367209]